MGPTSSSSSTGAAPWKMWLVKVYAVMYLISVCAAQDPEDATRANRAPVPSTSAPLAAVTEPPAPFLQRQSAWSHVFPSEKVELSCILPDSADWTFTWLKDDKPLQDSDPNVAFSSEGSVLTLTAASPAYSGNYSCKGHHKTSLGVATVASNQLELSVYANKPKPTMSPNPKTDKMFSGEKITFTCTVDIPSEWEYLWYRGDNEIHTSTQNTFSIDRVNVTDSGEYHCRAKRGKGPFLTEQSEETALQVSDPPTPSLKQLSSWLDVFQDETVELGCEMDSSDWTFTWYKDGVKLEEDGVYSMDLQGFFLNITTGDKNQEGAYTCRAHHKSRAVISGYSHPASITVYENTPKPTLRRDSGLDLMYVGERVTFTCNVNISYGWSYQWRKDTEDLPQTGETISVRLGLSDGGEYSCKATRSETTTTVYSEGIKQGVIEIPVPSLIRITSWLDVFPQETVRLRCDMNDSSGWSYTWTRRDRPLQPDGVVSFDSNGATLTISSASNEHSGKYKCKGHLKDRSVSSNSSAVLGLKVYDKKPRAILTQDPDYKVMFPGESVTLACNVNVSSGWRYQLYKDGKLRDLSEKRNKIGPIEVKDRGSYMCSAERGGKPAFGTGSSQAVLLHVEGNKPKPVITQEPDVGKLFTGESVSFECKVDGSSGWAYLWKKDGAQIHNNNTLTIDNANVQDSGTYSCIATRHKTNYVSEKSDRLIEVSEIPVPTLMPISQWLDVFPTESFQMKCGMDAGSDWIYTWLRDGQEVQAGGATSFDSNGATLTVSSASASHSGLYSCSARLKDRPVVSNYSSGVTLKVYDTKPRVMLLQDPQDNVLHTGDKVYFSCHVNVSSGWEYVWYKGGEYMKSGRNHTISSAVTADTGSYQCQTKREGNEMFDSDKSQTVTLNIKERPQANINLLTGWSEVFSTDTLVLECDVQGHGESWNYTWYKEEQTIDHPPSQRYYVTPENDPDQSEYKCKGFQNVRPYHSRMSDTYKTKNLLLKRRVLLSISGCLFFGIIAVFLGCIALRVFRKPADEYEKPEEPDLFLSMSPKNGFNDAPCPLVEFITDAALNASPKEGDEDDPLCSETTPLPITSQEDTAGTSESNDTKENNGLVSFKQ